MRLEDLSSYVSGLDRLTKIKITSEDDTCGHLVITATEETYVFEDEDMADDKVNEARQNNGFAGVTKKYKAGKVNKSGDIVKPETWTVVIKLNH